MEYKLTLKEVEEQLTRGLRDAKSAQLNAEDGKDKINSAYFRGIQAGLVNLLHNLVGSENAKV